jgi:predicted GH43/DUF377 family glycosyl hydrolase
MDRVALELHPDASRVVMRPFLPANDPLTLSDPERSRLQRIADRILALDETTAAAYLVQALRPFEDRAFPVELIFDARFEEVNGRIIGECSASRTKTQLIGAYLHQEYSYEAAALFNPSIVPHPDQANLPEGSLRFVMSLRGVGEGHISSVTFRTGIYNASTGLSVDTPSSHTIAHRLERDPDAGDGDGSIWISCDEGHDLSERVLFPVTAQQRNGIEDLRLVRFVEDDGSSRYLGTYTAYDGRVIAPELLTTGDFATFNLHRMEGPGAINKGLAFFPRRIDGKYALLCRHDDENIWFAVSDSLQHWGESVSVVAPRYPWEFIKIGNCGSPIELDEGWLVITHGVGAVRNYAIGACLLDKTDPSKLLARTPEPLLRATAHEREGYVPNVVYSCGSLVHDRTLLLPFAIADSYTTFATVPVDRLLAIME